MVVHRAVACWLQEIRAQLGSLPSPLKHSGRVAESCTIVGLGVMQLLYHNTAV